MCNPVSNVLHLFFLTSLLSCPWTRSRMLRMRWECRRIKQKKSHSCFDAHTKIAKAFPKICQNTCKFNCLDSCKLVYLLAYCSVHLPCKDFDTPLSILGQKLWKLFENNFNFVPIHKLPNLSAYLLAHLSLTWFTFDIFAKVLTLSKDVWDSLCLKLSIFQVVCLQVCLPLRGPVLRCKTFALRLW